MKNKTKVLFSIIFLFVPCLCNIYDLDLNYYEGRVKLCTLSSDASLCPCASGYTNAFMCITCTVGKFKSSYGNSQCSLCSENALSLPGSTSNKACFCRSGYYRSAVSNQCVLCPNGKYSPFISNEQCFNCPKNSTTYHPGSTSRDACLCSAAHEPVTSGQCETCSVGKFKSEIGNMPCEGCDKNEFSAQGSFSKNDCVCEKGYTRTAMNTCVRCEKGYFKDWRGNSACLQCPSNSYSPYEGSTSCLACSPGLTSGPSSTSVDNCVCPTGMRRKFDPQVLEFTCELCDFGSYQDVESASTTCKSCPVNADTTSIGSAALASCICKRGHTLVQNTCTECESGKFKDTLSNSECKPCNVSSISHSGQSSCTHCAEHSSNNHDHTICICDPGFTKQCTDSLCTCQACSSGKFKALSGDQACSDCASGKFSAAASTQCHFCTKGKFAINGGSHECVDCFQNSSSSVGSAVCECDAGFASIMTTVGVSCRPCRRGYYCVDGVEHKCPEHTISEEGSVSVDDCVCLQGYIEQ